MPIYEYKCTSCGHKKEVLQRLSDAPLKECPACGKATLSKLISAAGFQLKGSGWYATDFKGSPKSGKEKEDGKAKDESKPAVDSKASDGEKPKEEKKSDKPADTAGASPAVQ
jgi:putative FmdB family regulatory protein